MITFCPAVFQFLIGRLKTLSSEVRGDWLGKFQFLIGRLKTVEKAMAETMDEESFNSL